MFFKARFGRLQWLMSCLFFFLFYSVEFTMSSILSKASIWRERLQVIPLLFEHTSLIISSSTIVSRWGNSGHFWFTSVLVFVWNGWLMLSLLRTETSASSYIALKIGIIFWGTTFLLHIFNTVVRIIAFKTFLISAKSKYSGVCHSRHFSILCVRFWLRIRSSYLAVNFFVS